MIKDIVYVLYYVLVCIIAVILSKFFGGTLLQSALIGLMVGMFAQLYVRPLIKLYIGD